ncbi:PAS domain S-box protein [Ancylothrix sp. C2]|uniref:PAS domain S-box protein n=1 Tax=Ancylothrix sp. D3o TaxID=2953691 RepID=UPI0021BB297D|nr:PAS domain S-box protein [Ancylothrix sp. D3o]MCT7948649.1 PAS domain S-box protein [Ancylothrix sp. D3o]
MVSLLQQDCGGAKVEFNPFSLCLSFLSDTSLAFAMFDRQMRYLLCSRRWLAQQGIETEVIGITHYHIFPLTSEEEKEIHRRCLESGEEFSFEEWMGGKGEKGEWLKVSVAPWRNEQGEVGGLIISKEVITAEKETLQKLQISQQRKRYLAHATSQIFWATNGEGQVEFDVPGWEAMTGQTKEQMQNGGWLDVVHPEDREKTAYLWQEAVRNKTVFEAEYRLRKSDGSYVYSLARAVPVLEADGSIREWVGANMDITERKQTEFALRETNNLLEGVLEAIPDPIFVKNLEGEYILLNKAAARVLGKSAKEIVGKNDGQILPPEIAESVMKNDRLIMDNGETKIIEEIVKQGNQFQIFHSTKTIYRDSEGKIVGLVGISRDVTERKQIEEKLRKSEANLLEAQRLAHIGSWEFDIIAQQISWSEELFRIHGLDPAGGEPSYEENLDLIHPEDREYWLQKVGLGLQGSAYEMEYRISRSDASVRYLYGQGQPIFNECGEVVRMFGTARDITEQKLAEIELQKYQEHLEELVKERTAALEASNAKLSQEITDRQQAEASLVESYNLLQAVLEGVSDAIYVKDLQGYYILANSATMAVFNRPMSEVMGKTDCELIGQEMAETVQETDRRIMATGAAEMLEESLPDHKGEMLTFLSAKSPYRDAGGKIMGLIGVSRNITERKKIEDALRAEKHFSLQISETIPNLLYIYDLVERRNIYSNRPVTELLGFSAEEVQKLGENVMATLIHPEDLPRILEYHGALAQSEEDRIFEIEYRIIDRQGQWHWFYSRETIFARTLEGKAKQMLGCSEDVTAKKQAETGLRESQALLLEKANREMLINRLASQIRNSLDIQTILQTTVNEIRSLFKIENCHFVWYKPQGNPPSWEIVSESINPGIPSFLGSFTLEQVGPFALRLASLELIRVDDVGRLSDGVFQEFLTSVGIVSVLSLPLQTRSGEIGIVSCCQHTKKRRWTDGEEELLKAVCDQLAIAIYQAELYTHSRETARLATLQASQLEETLKDLQRAQAQLIQSEKMSSLGQLVAGVAHEINNPVSFIFGNVEHAKAYIESLLGLLSLYGQHYPNPHAEIAAAIDTYELDFIVEDLPKLMSSMKAGATRIRDIVRSLRSFSRLDESEIKPVSLHEGIDNTLLILEHRLKTKPGYPPIEIIKNYGDLPDVECYASQLNQAFMNILNNAIDALEEQLLELPFEDINSALRQIKISTFLGANQRAVIVISDTGPGMSPEVKARLFDPFFTTKPVGTGTGLGLAISYQIVVQKHKGSLSCSSILGSGSKFTVEIPIKQG